jgi:hypothetical protein
MLALALGLLFTAPLPAADDGGFECTLETFKGSYIYTRNGTWEAEDGQRHPRTTVGVMRPDGQGGISYMAGTQKRADSRQTFTRVGDWAAGTVTGFRFKWGEEPQEYLFPVSGQWEYSIEPSCSGVMKFTRPNGRVSSAWRIILTNGGRDGILSDVGSDTGLWMGTLRRIDNSDQELEDRVARIAEVIWKIALRLGINPVNLPQF